MEGAAVLDYLLNVLGAFLAVYLEVGSLHAPPPGLGKSQVQGAQPNTNAEHRVERESAKKINNFQHNTLAHCCVTTPCDYMRMLKPCVFDHARAASDKTRNGTKRNEMEKSVKRVDSEIEMHERLQGQMRQGGLQADKQDTECTLAGLNPMLRVSGLHPKLRVSGLHPMLRQRDPAARLIVCFC